MRKKDFWLKIFSLGVGMAISFVLIAKVCFESSYDNFYSDVDQIYKIKTNYTQRGNTMDFGQVSGGVAPGFKQYVPGVEAATRTTFFFSGNRYVLEDKKVITGEFAFADTCFFDVFQRPILVGNPKEVLQKPIHVMVSRSFAEKVAPLEEVVGRQIYNEEHPHIKLTIGGVFEDFPDNGSLHFDVLCAMTTYSERSTLNWMGNDRYRGYVKLQPGVDPPSLKSAIRSMQEKFQPLEEMEQQDSSIRYYLTPFNTLHTSDPLVRNFMLILSAVSFILLMVSLMNYSLISISEMVKRAKEVGVRKCYGAEGHDIYRWLAKETGVTFVLSLLLAALLIWAAKPLVENLMDVQLLSLFIPETLMVLVVVLLLMMVLSILIPGYLYARVPVNVVFRNYQMNKRRWKLILLTFQFVISVCLTSFLWVISVQYNKVLNADPGYDVSRLYYVHLPGADDSDLKRCVDRLATLSEVEAVERAYGLPMNGTSGNNIFLPNDSRGELFNVADQYSVTDGFMDMLQIPLLEGRQAKPGYEVMVNQSFVDKMKEFADWPDGVVGKEIFVTEHSDGNRPPLTITGVYADYTLGGRVSVADRPSILFVSEGDYMTYILVKLREETPEALAEVRAAVADCMEGRELEVYSYEAELDHLYDDYQKIRNTFLVGVVFSIVIAFMGLIGYIREEALRRSKEIAIRKVNGATVSEIIGMFVKDIARLLVVAILIGDAAAYYVTDLFLQQFPIKMELSVGYFLGADAVVVLLVVAVVVLNCVKIARSNPVLSLKNE